MFNLKVEDAHEYFANGLLVHNCQWEPQGGMKSPNRLDALVWALTELYPHITKGPKNTTAQPFVSGGQAATGYDFEHQGGLG